jgi:lysine 2,3-aminomutase
MALQKKEDNKKRPDGEKYAEIVRIRLGTRLPIYLPQRVTPELIEILQSFRERARKIGIRQFVIQTHYESPMEVTPESRQAVQRFLNAGWMVTNQLVFTAAASRRGHTAKLRSILNDIGVLSYYTFTVKGYMENNFNFAPNARVMQEQIEEKQVGKIPDAYNDRIAAIPEEPQKMIEQIGQLRRELDTPFLATDRNVLNLPGVGKSLTYRVIGITRYGRRILGFDHDPTRTHSPIIHKMGKIVVIESKSISEYLQQLEELGEDISEYSGLYGYSIGETEKRAVLYEYPEYDFQISPELTNLELEE